MREMKGYIVPIFTPFNQDGTIDHEALRQSTVGVTSVAQPV